MGYSGHGRVISEAAQLQGFELMGYFQSKEADKNPLRLSYLGDESGYERVFFQNKCFILGIGDNQLRSAIFTHIKNCSGTVETVVHPSAILSNNTLVEEGSFINASATIQSGVTIAENTIINTKASIDHDCVIGSHVHCAPGAVLCGGVRVGNYSLIGAGAVVIQGISIGANTIIGAGSVITKDVPDNVTVVGNPPKFI